MKTKLVCFAVGLAFISANAPAATYVISTDEVPLTGEDLNAIGAVNGINTPGYVFFSPTSLGSINGTPLTYGGVTTSGGADTDANTAVFGLAGNLTLNAGDQIIGLGSKFLRIEVGGDATIAAGAKVTAQAFGREPGPGGGAGGLGAWVPLPAALASTQNAPPIPSGGNNDAGGNGLNGKAAGLVSFVVSSDNWWWAYPFPGSAGTAGVRSRTTAGLGGVLNRWIVLPLASGGQGGTGGLAGSGVVFVFAARPAGNGGNGQNGQAGTNGIAGSAGASAGLGLPDDGGLYGGAGGAGGDQGGSGLLGGAGGGGGAGGQGGKNFFGTPGELGGNGGDGGQGGRGGEGGKGGGGGGGGGGLELFVRGSLYAGGNISARGGNGSAGYPGDIGTGPIPGEAGRPTRTNTLSVNGTRALNVLPGGYGGRGGSTGAAGNGGHGGQGGGGAGGTVILAANKIHWGGAVDVAGGTGATNTAPGGIFRYRSDIDGIASNGNPAPTTTRANPYNSYLALELNGLHERTPVVHGDYRLIGGPDVYGLLLGFWNTNAGLTVRTNYGTSWQASPPAPSNAVGLVQRVNFRSTNTPLDQLLFINIRNAELKKPFVAANRASDDMKAVPTPLQVRGYSREWPFAANPTGAQMLSVLPSYHTWLTYLRPGNSTLTAVFTPYSTPVTNTFLSSGSASGAQNFWLLDTGLLSVDTTPPAALAPVSQQADRQTNALTVTAYARRGPGTPLTFNVRNTGRAGSLMSSVSGSSLVFSNLSPSSAPATLSLPVGRTNQPNPILAKIVTDAGTINISAQATIVGPAIETALTETNANQVVPGQTRELIFTAQNTFLPTFGTPGALYQGNILSVSIVGPDAAFFSLQGPTQGVIPLKYTLLGTSDISWTNRILFTPTAARDYIATLQVQTDDYAPTGMPGRVYSFSLNRSVVTPVITITQQPADTTGQIGGTATFNIAATVTPNTLPLTYQWKEYGLAIPGATDSTYTTGPLGGGGYYTCELRAGTVSVESDVAWVSIVSTNRAYAQAVLADQPVLYYQMDEVGGTTTFDSSGHGNHGTRSNVLEQAAYSPLLGIATEFRGAAWGGSIAVPALINPASGNSSFSQLTVEAWVKLVNWNPLDAPADFGISALFSGNGFPPGSFQLVAIRSNILAFTLHGSSSEGLANDYAVTDPALTTDIWLHLATVYDTTAKTFRLYTNGAEAMVVNLTNAPPAFMTNSHLGAWLGFDGNLHRFLDGLMDEVAVYNKALSVERIAAHYQAAAWIGISIQPESVAVGSSEPATFTVLASAAGTSSPLTYQWKRGPNVIPGATNDTYITQPLGPSDNGASFVCTLSAGQVTLDTEPAFVTIAATNTPYPQAVLADAPLLYYRLEEQGVPRAFDSSGNWMHGRYSNVIAAPGPAPWLGSSASFGGQNAQASIAVPALINPLTLNSFFSELTVEAWVKLKAWNSQSSDAQDYGLSGLFCGDQWPEGSFQFVAVNEGYLALGVRDSYGENLFNDYAVFNPTLFKTNEWMHLATVYDSVAKTFRLYVNGAQAAVFTLEYAPPAYFGPSHLGAWLGFDNLLHRFVDGQLDEVAVYGTALSAERIAVHHDAAVSIQITQQPVDAAASPGGTATFIVAAVTPGANLPLRYQWHRDGNPILDATNATYITGPVALADSGASFRCTLAVGPFSKESTTTYVTVIATNGAHAQAVLADQPLLYYRFEEQNGSTIFDSSGHGYHGTASNVFHESGPVGSLGSAAGFQGYDNFDKPGSIAVPALINSLTSDSLFNQVTLVTWVKLNDWNFVDVPGDSLRSTLFGSDSSMPGAFGLSARTINEFSLDLAGSGGGGMIDFYPVYDANVFVPGVWLHLAAVYDAIGHTFKLYTNGALCETVTLQTAPPALLWQSHIGAWQGALPILQRLLNGQLDELAVFGTALSAARIAAQYQAATVIHITQQPTDISVQPGGSVMFTIEATTLGAQVPLTYQWKRNGAPIANATDSSYTTPVFQASDNGAQYSCTLTAGPASLQSATAVVTVVDISAPYPSAVLADQPLLYYRLEEQGGTTAQDSSGNGYHGTYRNVERAGGPAPWLGSSASFRGLATRASIAVPALINPATEDSFFSQVTVEAWVKLNAWNELFDSTDFGLSAIFSGDNWPEGSFQFVAANANRFSFGVRDSSGEGFFNDYSSTDYALFNTNTWLHVATVYDSAVPAFRLYVNGTLKEQVPLDVAPAANLAASHIGAWLAFDQNLYRFLEGQVDEVAVYGTALTAQQIAAHYQAAVAIRITQQPVDAQVLLGGSVNFTVAASAPGATVPLRYEWRRNGVAIPNATNATYTISSITYGDYGANYHCAVSAGPFTVESAVAWLTILATNTAYAHAVLADQPLLYYRMEELGGSTVFDSSGHGFHGTRANVQPQPGVWPDVGLAAGFQGAVAGGHITVPALIHPVSGGSSFNALTVEAWVRLNQWNIDDFGLSGIFTGNGWPAGSFQFVAATTNRFLFGVRDSTGGGFANDYEAVDPVVFTTNVWLHLATTYDTASKTFRFYTNGVEARRVDLSNAPPAFMTNSHIGAWLDLDGYLSRFFDGQIDEVAVYATALPPTRITAHYQSAFPALIAASPEGSNLRLDWVLPGAVVQQNTNVANPSGWSDVPGGTISPIMVTPGPGQKFFRLKKP